ncbi:hypothetical protein PtrSN002B_009363, partial [Pyrenophora tritici-repentis]
YPDMMLTLNNVFDDFEVKSIISMAVAPLFTNVVNTHRNSVIGIKGVSNVAPYPVSESGDLELNLNQHEHISTNQGF